MRKTRHGHWTPWVPLGLLLLLPMAACSGSDSDGGKSNDSHTVVTTSTGTAVETSTRTAITTQTGTMSFTVTVTTVGTGTVTAMDGTNTVTATATQTQVETQSVTATVTITVTGIETVSETKTVVLTSTAVETGSSGGGSGSTKTNTGTGTGPREIPGPAIVPADSSDYAPRVENPYQGATGYVNPLWRAKAEAEPEGSRISNTPTGVWMDRIAAIYGGDGSMGLRDHLDEAIKQNAGYIQIVIYNLPGRDCAALASNGELGPTEIERYKSEYIDVIVKIMSDKAYAKLRIINIIEIDSLPNLITNTGGQPGATAQCDTMKANGNYVKGIQYALGKLHTLGNTYSYIDAAHHGWIGWDTSFGPSADLFATTAKGAEGGVDTVTGFITNTANYSVLSEPYLQLTEKTKESKWIDFNQYVDELTFAKAFRQKLVSNGFKSTIGMLIDTSRNGWGGSARPTGASSSSDIETQVNQSRIDRRIHAGNWCNQAGAGLGERPQVVNKDGIHAYVWIKPPGESDGASKEIPNDEGKGFDRMCDPTYGGNGRNKNNMSGALADAPISGQWFSAQFQELMKNAYPPL